MMRGRGVAAAIACVLAVAGASGGVLIADDQAAVQPSARHGRDVSRPARLHVGVIANTLDLGGLLPSTQDLARRSGARWLREEIRRYEVEPRPGMYRWARSDRVIGQASRRGLRVLPLLIGTPRWENPEEMYMPERPGGFARFTARVARRYGPGGTFWRKRPQRERRLAPRVMEVWNEPFLPQFAAGRVSARRYARLFRDAVRAGRRANHRTRYLLAVDTTYDTLGGQHRHWIPDLLRAVPDLRRYVWGLAVHPYSLGLSPDVYTPGISRYQFLRLREVRDAWGGSSRIWITELGWSTCPSGNECVSEANQARYLREALEVLRTERIGVRAVFVYRLRDWGTPNPSDREQWFGLRRADGSPKRAWFAFVRIAKTSR